MRLGRVCCALILVAFAVLLLVTFASEAAATPIGVTGTLTLNGSFGVFDLSGDRGFTLKSAVDAVGGREGPWNSCSPCRPGDPISPVALWSGTDLFGSTTLDGVQYRLGMCVGEPGCMEGIVSLNGPALIAPKFDETTSSVVILTEGGIQLTGVMSYCRSRPPPVDCPREELVGSGTLSLVLHSESCGPLGDCWILQSGVYELTPEPTTLLLFGTAMAGVGLARWKRRSQK